MTKTLRFVKQSGVIYRVLLETPVGCWLIDCNGPSPPFFAANLDRYERVPAPDGWMDDNQTTPAQEARLQMIQPLLDCDDCISDKSLRYKMAADVAQQYQTTTRRILRLYYRYVATGQVTAKREPRKRTQNNQAIERAIRQYYYGSKRLSLRAAYEMMLLPLLFAVAFPFVAFFLWDQGKQILVLIVQVIQCPAEGRKFLSQRCRPFFMG